MRVIIRKSARRLTLMDEGAEVLSCRVALSETPVGAKLHKGDGRTPEGVYRVCLEKPEGKYGKSLGLNYPNERDAMRALTGGRIDTDTARAICLAAREKRRPPWGTPLGGEIYIHAGGADRDWTQGCIALDEKDMEALYALRGEIGEVEISP